MRVTTSRRCRSAGTSLSTDCVRTSRMNSTANVNLHLSPKGWLDGASACKNPIRTRLHVFATRRRGTVAQANLRLAAGVGVVAACLLVGGPSAAVAIADPDGGSRHSDNVRGSDSNVRGGSRGAQTRATITSKKAAVA